MRRRSVQLLGRQADKLAVFAAVLAALLSAGAAPGAAQAPAELDTATVALMARGLAALQAGPQAGFVASGTATLYEADGVTESGPITASAWGADHCKVTIDLSLPGRKRRYEAVANGPRVHVTSPQRLRPGTMLAGPGLGCVLLPAALPWSAARGGTASGTSGSQIQLGGRLAVGLDAASGLPASAAWKFLGRSVALGYAGYQNPGGLSYPETVRLQVDGALRLEVQWDTVEPHAGFTEGDFPAPPPPKAPALQRGGGQ
ncbi:MAG: hypothetical protein ACRD1L_08505 [Terriglobales bacterium]